MKSTLALCSVVAVLCSATQAQQTAYLVDSNLDQLFTVDLATGAATFVASTANNGLETPADLTWKEDSGELWTLDLSGGEVGTIDTSTGVFTPVYQTGVSGWQAMAWDQTTRLFFLWNQDDNTYVLDPGTGQTSLLGNSTQDLITCLDVDTAGTLYGFDFLTGNWCLLDKGTGVATVLATTLGGFQGLSYDVGSGLWYGTNTNDDSLYTVDPATGVPTLVGPHGGVVTFAKGFEITAGPPLTSFCTAKPRLVCGTPSIYASGVSSISATSGFVVSAGRAVPGRTGVLLYNQQLGAIPIPFLGGTLCVEPAGLSRGGPTTAMGTCAPGSQACDGVFSIDMNAFAASVWVVPDCSGSPAGIPANAPAFFLANPGTTVYSQYWGRDSVATGTYLSDGVSWTVGP